MLNVIMLNVIMLNVIMRSVIKLNVIMLSVDSMNVMAPKSIYIRQNLSIFRTLQIHNVLWQRPLGPLS
jgi:hypothetical protein